MRSIRPIALALVALCTIPQAARAQDIQNLYVGDGPVHFSLRSGEAVPDSAVTESNWDFVIDGVDLTPNGAGALVDQAFDAMDEVPEQDLVDGVFRSQTGAWYNYDQNSHFVWPEPDRTFVLSLPDGRFAKFEIYSYYNFETEEPRYVSFRYALTDEGSSSF